MVNALLKLCLLCVLIVIAPFMWIWMMIDYRRLKRTALDMEPLNIPPARTLVDRVFAVVREIIFFIALPLIAIVGMFMSVLSADEEDDCWDR